MKRRLFLLLCAFSTGVAFAGFAGRDPRYPGFAERNFGLPFKAMFIGAHPDDADYQFGSSAPASGCPSAEKPDFFSRVALRRACVILF